LATTVTQDPFRKGSEAILGAREKLASARAVLLDWDGCIAFENRPTADALRFLAEWQDRAIIVSNNSTNLPEDFSRILERAGVLIPAERIVLAGMEAVRRATEFGDAPVMLLAESRVKAHARKLGVNIVREQAKVVLLLRDTRLTYLRLERAVNSIKQGAQLIVANPDACHRGARDKIVPETGALLAAIHTSLDGRPYSKEVIGKPKAGLFARACDALKLRASDVVMIGDNPDTDAAGARAAGMPHILIGAENGVEFGDLLYAGRHAGYGKILSNRFGS
jgi:4-nitrophenyl phosphatase